MAHIAKDDCAAARCDACGNIYTVIIHPQGEMHPVGVPNCRGCGGLSSPGDIDEEVIETEQ